MISSLELKGKVAFTLNKVDFGLSDISDCNRSTDGWLHAYASVSKRRFYAANQFVILPVVLLAFFGTVAIIAFFAVFVL